jgi:hypothetical protein
MLVINCFIASISRLPSVVSSKVGTGTGVGGGAEAVGTVTGACRDALIGSGLVELSILRRG